MKKIIFFAILALLSAGLNAQTLTGSKLEISSTDSHLARFYFDDNSTIGSRPRLDIWGTSNNINLRTTHGNSPANLSFGTHVVPEALFILHNGNIGIGTNNPSAKLHIVDQGTSSVTTFQLNNRIKFRGDGVINWGAAAAHGTLSWNTGKALLGGLSGNDLSLLANGVEKMIIKTNGNIGIGTEEPNSKLDIYNSNVFDNSESNFLGDNIVFKTPNHPNGSYFGGLTWNNNNRRRASIVAVKEHNDSDHVGLAFFTRGADGAGPIYESMRISYAGNVGIGTTTPTHKLDVCGTIRSKEVIVETNWCDFVFASDYNLISLEDLEQYINQHKHLPDVPSEKEVKENGLSLGQSDAVLLQKIEELTLYLIEQNKEVKSEKLKVESLEKENVQLKTEINELKKLNNKLIELENQIEILKTKK